MWRPSWFILGQHNTLFQFCFNRNFSDFFADFPLKSSLKFDESLCLKICSETDDFQLQTFAAGIQLPVRHWAFSGILAALTSKNCIQLSLFVRWRFGSEKQIVFITGGLHESSRFFCQRRALEQNYFYFSQLGKPPTQTTCSGNSNKLYTQW